MTEVPAAPALLKAESAGVTFPGPLVALDGVELQIPAGQFVSVVGPSGCGKSTLLRMFAGLQRASRGLVTVGGVLPSMARSRRTRMAFVFQDPTLLPWRTVAETIALPLELVGADKAVSGESVRGGLGMIGLSDFAGRFPTELSGGMRMRVSLARALVNDPEILLLDEPFAALDDMTRYELNEELLRLWAKHVWTGVFVTHNIAEAVFLSQRVVVMSPRPGRVVAEFHVPFAMPRSAELRVEAEFARLCGAIMGVLRRAAE